MQPRNLDPLPVNRILGVREYIVTNEQLERYLVGIKAHSNRWYTEDSPYGGPVCPASILFYEPMHFPGPRQYRADASPYNSGAAWEFSRPIRRGQALTLREKVADRWIKRGREYAVFQMDALDTHGRVVARCDFKESWDAPPNYEPPLPNRDHEPGSLKIEPSGRELGRLSRLFTFEMSSAFCRPERNLHTSREMARARGFSDVVIAGPQFVCQMSELMTRMFGRGYYEGGKLAVNFLRPVLAGELITARAVEHTRRDDGGGQKRAEVVIWCENAAGQKTAAGIASAVLGDAEPEHIVDEC